MQKPGCIFVVVATLAHLVACQPMTMDSPINVPSVLVTPDSPITTATIVSVTSTPQETSPTPPPTRDYASDLECYLTPYPRATAQPTPTPQMTSVERDALFATKISDLLAQIEIRTVTTAQLNIPPRLTETLEAETEYIQIVTDLMNLTQGNEVAYLEHVAMWVPGTTLDELGYVWIYTADLDQDGALEWLVSVPLRRRALRGGRPTGYAKPVPAEDDWIGCSPNYFCHRMIVLFECVNGMFKPSYVLNSRPFSVPEFGVWFNTTSVLLTEDLNLNGIPEILLESKWCGASTCGSELFIGEWDGENWHSSGWINQSFAEFVFEDWNQDGLKDILAHGGGTGSASFVIQRQHTIVYAWEQNWYMQIADIPDPNSHPYFRIIDANTALAENQPQTALELAGAVLRHFKNQDCSAITENANIIAYAGIESMLAQVVLQDDVDLDFPKVLEDMENVCRLGDNPYIEAAHILQAAYEYSQDQTIACSAMEHYVLAQRDVGKATRLMPVFFYERAPTSYAWEGIKILCPLYP